MPAGNGNIQNYVTTETCSIVLSMGCYIQATDGWYSDGTYSYYISGNYITQINYDPCYVAPPPPPPPPSSYMVTLGYGGDTDFACGYSNYDTFYLDSSTLSGASAVWTDSGLTNRAFGFTYYSDGTLVRFANRQGSLGAAADCGNPE